MAYPKCPIFAILLLLGQASAFKPTKLYRNINEEQSIDGFILDIKQEVGYRDDEAKLTLISGDEYLKITETSLYVGKKIDREAVCPVPSDKPCVIEAEVLIKRSRGKEPISVPIRLTVKDINDNDPVFPNQNIPIDISEGAQIGSVYRLVSATDADSAKHGIKEYKLNGLGVFELEEETHPDGSIIPSIRLKKELDREEQGTYEMNLTVRDFGGRSSDAHIVVTVLDINDHKPHFVNGTKTIYLSESTDPNYPIYQVVAIDEDIGDNGQITYRYSSTVTDTARRLFSLNTSDGWIRVAERPDYESETIHRLYIEAHDGGTDTKHDYCTVTIHITDSNDKKPEIKVSWLLQTDNEESDNQKYEVSEDAQIGRLLAWVSVTDDDTGAAGRVKTVLQNDLDFELVETDNRTDAFYLKIKQPLDRETKSSYDLTIVSTDNGDPQLESTETLHIDILDINDNAPTFIRRDYEATIKEDAGENDEVITVKATDSDLGENGCFDYTLKDTHVGRFAIEQTGDCQNSEAVIRLAQKLDADSSDDSYVLNITATDHGTPPRSDYTILTIKVGDVNDNKPTFSQSKFVFNVPEDAGAKTLIGSVEATDADKDPENSRITYFFSDTGANRGPFELNADTGEISTLEDLDAELWKENNRWDFEIKAEDHGLPPKSSKAQVTINLIDQNDNAPRFISPNPQTDVIMKSEIEFGDIILNDIEAEDLDATSPNNQFFFQLDTSHKNSKLFKIDDESGKLTYNAEDKIYGPKPVRVIATDRGNPPLNNTDPYMVNVYFLRPGEQINITMALKAFESEDDGWLGAAMSDFGTYIIGAIIGIAIICLIVLVVVIIKCRWKNDKEPKQLKYSVSSKNHRGNLLSTHSHQQDGTLDSRNDFQGEWTRPTNSMNQMHLQERIDPHGNHSFTSRDSGTGDSVPTDHQFPPPPVPQQPRDYGDESWMTNSIMRNQSQQYNEKNAPYEVSDSFVVGYESAGGFPYYEGAGQNPYLQNQHKPKFSTFMDDQSDTSSMSTALLNGHLSPHFDTFASSAQNTLERSRQNTLERKAHNNPDYDDGDVSVIQTIPEDDTIILTNDRYYQDSEPGIFKN